MSVFSVLVICFLGFLLIPIMAVVMSHTWEGYIAERGVFEDNIQKIQNNEIENYIERCGEGGVSCDGI